MPKTTRRLAVHPISLRELTVLRIEDLTTGMRRVVLGGAQLEAFTSANGIPQPAFRSEGFDDDIRLIFPYPGRTEPVLPIQEEGHLEFPKDPRPISKVYTVRRWDPANRELTVDFVKHGTGIATIWAYRAQPGDRIHIAGPAASRDLPRADCLLVVGDDTAVPAISRLLEELPADVRAQVFIEIASDEHRQRLRELPGVTVTWLSRHGAPAGSTTLLIDAVTAATWDGSVFAWIAGESTMVTSVRRHLVQQRDVPRDHIEFTGYWRLGEVVTLDDDPVVPDPERNQEAFAKLHELAELLPPLAIRAAVNLGLAEQLSTGVTGPDDLAAAAGADPIGVAKLLRYLHSIEIVRPSADGGYELTDAGGYLTDDFVVDILHRDGYDGRRQLAFFGLEESVRTGREGYTAATGADFASLLGQEWYEHRMLGIWADYGRYLAEPLATLPIWESVGDVTVRSDGAGVLAQALVANHPGIRVRIAALPSRCAWFRTDLSSLDEGRLSRISFTDAAPFDPTPASDAVLIVRTLAALANPDAVLALRRAAGSLTPGGRLFVHEERLNPDEADEHEAEADLLNYTLHGTGVRTDAELRMLFDAAGLEVENAETFGWGSTLYRLSPR